MDTFCAEITSPSISSYSDCLNRTVPGGLSLALIVKENNLLLLVIRPPFVACVKFKVITYNIISKLSYADVGNACYNSKQVQNHESYFICVCLKPLYKPQARKGTQSHVWTKNMPT